MAPALGVESISCWHLVSRVSCARPSAVPLTPGPQFYLVECRRGSMHGSAPTVVPLTPLTLPCWASAWKRARQRPRHPSPVCLPRFAPATPSWRAQAAQRYAAPAAQANEPGGEVGATRGEHTGGRARRARQLAGTAAGEHSSRPDAMPPHLAPQIHQLGTAMPRRADSKRSHQQQRQQRAG